MDTWADEGLLDAVSTGEVSQVGMGGGVAVGTESPRAEDLGVREHSMGAVSQPAFLGA